VGRIAIARHKTLLEELLTIFEQTSFTDEKSDAVKQYSHTPANADVQTMVGILHHIATDPAERKVLDDEIEYRRTVEEYFGKQFAAIAEKDERLRKQSVQLKEKSELLKEKDERLQDQSVQLKGQSEQLKEKDERLKGQSEQLKEKDERLKGQSEQLKGQSEQLKGQSEQLKVKDEQLKDQNETIAQLQERIAQLERKQ
jgi:chromosome segregation ATPase